MGPVTVASISPFIARSIIVDTDRKAGTRLTEEGRALLDRYSLLKKRCLEAEDMIFRDIFGTVKRDFTNIGENFEQHILMQREPRVVTLTLSYRINNYRDGGDRRGGGGGDMDFGGGL